MIHMVDVVCVSKGISLKMDVPSAIDDKEMFPGHIISMLLVVMLSLTPSCLPTLLILRFWVPARV
jgi:hypothetical protein